MKSITIVFLFYLICPKLSGQNSEHPEYLNQTFQIFKPNQKINVLEKNLTLKLTNVAACLAMLELPKEFLSIEEEYEINERLQEIAEKLFLQGTPIYLIKEGKNSMLKAGELNVKKSKNGISYVSLGNSCISSKRLDKGVNLFNNRTLALIKLKEKH
jgi:hypothetical protein